MEAEIYIHPTIERRSDQIHVHQLSCHQDTGPPG